MAQDGIRRSEIAQLCHLCQSPDVNVDEAAERGMASTIFDTGPASEGVRFGGSVSRCANEASRRNVGPWHLKELER